MLYWHLIKCYRENSGREQAGNSRLLPPLEEHMPRRPKHPCRFPRCPELTDKKYCPEHTRIMNARSEKYKREPGSRRRYKGSWPEIRAAYIAAHPFCEVCYQKWLDAGCPPTMVPPRTEHVHHRLPLAEGGTHAAGNLQALCKSCHSRLHAERGDMWHDR